MDKAGQLMRPIDRSRLQPAHAQEAEKILAALEQERQVHLARLEAEKQQQETESKTKTTAKGKKPEPEEPEITLEDLRPLVKAYMVAEGGPALRKLLDSFGANKLTEVSEDDYPKMIAAMS